MPEADALAVPCSRCTAGVGEPCERPDGRELAKPHADRRKRAAAELERARLQAEGDATHRIASRRWRRVFAAGRLELEQRAAWTPLAAEQLESIVRNMAAAEAARAIAEASPTVEGSMGQTVANPMTAVALRYDGQALANARALKLTPDTRGTSAPAGDGDVGDGEENKGDEEPGDALSELDELARRRKAKPPPRKGRRARG